MLDFTRFKVIVSPAVPKIFKHIRTNADLPLYLKVLILIHQLTGKRPLQMVHLLARNQ